MKIIRHCDLTCFNSYRIPSECRIAYFPESVEDATALFQRHLSGQKPILLGSGHNVILASAHYEEPFVIFNGNFNEITVAGHTVTIGAGAFTQTVCEKMLAHGLSGFEMFYDIPSSIGGAIVMNAGAKDEDIAGILQTVTYLDTRHPTPEVRTIANEEAVFRYRNSLFQQNPDMIVLSATFQLQSDNPVRIKQKMETIKAERWAKQPRQYPNAGSVFKRPDGRFVGPMLDELHLKGYTHGGFRVSPKHSGFIEKVGPATGQQLLELIEDIQQRVRERFGVELEPEQRIITTNQSR